MPLSSRPNRVGSSGVGGDWRNRRNPFGPQIGSSRENVVTFVPLAYVFENVLTGAHAPLSRFELYSGTITHVFSTPVDTSATRFVVTVVERIVFGGGGGWTLITPLMNEPCTLQI